jgi:hypothetical protein
MRALVTLRPFVPDISSSRLLHKWMGFPEREVGVVVEEKFSQAMLQLAAIGIKL